MGPIAAKGKAEPLVAYRLVAVRAGAAGHARRLDAPLVGRERELGRLTQAFGQAVADRSCQLFTLLGTAGVGKSRLVAEFIGALPTDVLVLRGGCLPYGEGITYWPLRGIVHAAAGIVEADSPEEARTRLDVLLAGERDGPLLSARLANAIGLSAEPATDDEIRWAVRRLLETLARERPVVALFEDIHWAEPTLLDLVEHVADLARDAPLLLLCPARPELLDRRAGWGGGKLNATTVLLEPLAAGSSAELIERLPGGSALPAKLRTRILAAAEGNPLFLEEMLGMLVEEGLIVAAGDGQWLAAAELTDVRVPPTITALLAARLDQLTPDERGIAERGAVAGRSFDAEAIAALSPEALRPGVLANLVALVRKDLLRPEAAELSSGDAFRFRHVLIRDAAYGALTKGDRAALHERFANWLERASGERLLEYEEVLGYHLEQAYRYRTEVQADGAKTAAIGARASGHLLAAARRAWERGDAGAALGLFLRASEPIPLSEAKGFAPELITSLVLAGQIDAARATYSRFGLSHRWMPASSATSASCG